MRNALVCEWGISDIAVAEKQVVDSINFDIHMIHDTNGHHYIERITQIIPTDTDTGKHTKNCFRIRNIVEFVKESNSYRVSGEIEGEPAHLIGKDWYETFTDIRDNGNDPDFDHSGFCCG